MAKFTNKEKAAAARREVGYRERVYALRVTNGQMRQELADRQIALMREIAEDYEQQAQQDQPDLFPRR